MTYSLDLRKKVLQFLEKGNSTKEAAVKEAAVVFGISTRTIWHWMRRGKEESLAPKSRRTGGYKIDEEQLRKYIAEHPDAYLREIAEVFKTTLYAIFYACKRLKITLKKNDFLQGEGRSKKRAIPQSDKRDSIRESGICG